MNKHYIWVKSKCLDYYKFVNRLAKLNLKIYSIKYVNKEIYLKIEEDTLAKLNKYLVSYKFKVVKELGIYNFKNSLIKYKELLICLVIGLVLLFICTNLVVEVNIIHENKEIRELLMDELESAGIKTLSFKKSYNELQKIKENILEKYPTKIDWLEFETDGMILNVKVEERIITDTTKDNKKCNIIAKKEGTISSLLVSNGEALVRPNDLVKKGDVLISGIVNYNNEEKMRVCAKGEVFAHTWYTIKVSIPFEYNKYALTGKKKYNLIWSNKGNKTRIFKNRFSSFESKNQVLLKAFDYELLLETEYENNKQTLTYTEEEALNEGINKGIENLKTKLGEKDTIIDKKVLKKVVNDSTMDIEIFIVVNELISEEQIIANEAERIDESDMGNNQNNTE